MPRVLRRRLDKIAVFLPLDAKRSAAALIKLVDPRLGEVSDSAIVEKSSQPDWEAPWPRGAPLLRKNTSTPELRGFCGALYFRPDRSAVRAFRRDQARRYPRYRASDDAVGIEVLGLSRGVLAEISALAARPSFRTRRTPRSSRRPTGATTPPTRYQIIRCCTAKR